jgi:hypothetical protein
MKDRQLQAPGPAASRSSGEGFVGRVDALFHRYSSKYLPDKAERNAWEAATAGIRSFDRDEIVEVYRESRIPAERVAWLIRYRIRQSRDRWRDGTLYDYRNQLLPEPGTMRKAEIKAEFARWTDRLKDRPSDAEMEAWLDRDRTVLPARAMDHYKLARSQVITYAFLEEPGSRAKHARLLNGPMRYSRYKLIVFRADLGRSAPDVSRSRLRRSDSPFGRPDQLSL